MLDAKTTRYGLRVATIEASWATVHFVITTGPFLIGYALYLGANDFELGVLTALPLLAQVLQLPSAYFVERTGVRKKVALWPSVVGRSLWLPVAFLPWLHLSNPVIGFILLFGLSGALLNLAAPAWMAWMGDLVPARIRGRYFGKRNRIVALVTVVTSLGAGSVLDLADQRGNEYAGYVAIQLVAVAAGILAFLFLRKQPEPPYAKESPPGFVQYLLRPFREQTYRKVMVFYLYWLFAIGIASPFFSAHLIKHLGWSFKSIASLAVISAAVAVLVQPTWGKAIDRFGHKPVLTVASVAISHLPLYYAFCPYDLRWPIYANALLSGVFWSGFNTGVFNLILDSLPRRGRPGFVALQAALSGVMNFMASSFGGWIAHALVSVHWQWGSLTIVNYQILFTLTALLRVPGIFLLSRVDEPRAKRTAVLVRQAFIEINRRLGFGRQIVAVPRNNGARFRRALAGLRNGRSLTRLGRIKRSQPAPESRETNEEALPV